MSKTYLILIAIQIIDISLMRYIGKNFVTQPDWNIPRIFWNPFIARILVIGTQLLFVALIVLSFILTDHPWWFLIGSVLVFLEFASPPYDRSMFINILNTLLSRSGPGKYAAAKNALVAKYTFNSHGPDLKQKIDDQILSLLISGGIPAGDATEFKSRLRETQYFGMAAIAMANLQIKPGLSGVLFKDSWDRIRNPLVALTGAEKEIEMACDEIFRKHQVSVSISDVDQ